MGSMTDIVVAADAIEFLVLVNTMGRNLANEITMTIQTIGVKNVSASRPDSDRFFEILQCEPLRMAIAVSHLRHPFADEIVRNMAIVAYGVGVVTGLLPTVKLITHDMAVYAGQGLV